MWKMGGSLHILEISVSTFGLDLKSVTVQSIKHCCILMTRKPYKELMSEQKSWKIESTLFTVSL